MVDNYCVCISKFSGKVIVNYFSLHVDINKLDIFPHQMPRNERFSAECQFRVQNLLHVVTLHIIQKCKDYKDETKNANHSLANFVKVKHRKDLRENWINFIWKKIFNSVGWVACPEQFFFFTYFLGLVSSNCKK